MTLFIRAAQAPSPLVPGPFDVFWFVAVLAAAAVMAVALVAWSRDFRQVRGSLLVLVAIVLLPVAGPVAYLVARRRVSARG